MVRSKAITIADNYSINPLMPTVAIWVQL